MPKLDLPCHIYIGNGYLNSLDEFVIENRGSRAFVVMDSFLANPPINLHYKVEEILRKGNFESRFFSDYAGEPTTLHVEAALEVLKDFKADCIISIGGGSAIDLGKAVSLFAINHDLKWTDITKQPYLNRLPLIAVPTTSGTGSEATKVMVITNTETNFKMNPGHPNLIPDTAVLDPKLSISLPRHLTAYTGLDALTHAIEAYVSNRATKMTDLYALESIRIIGTALPRIWEDGADNDSREKMMLASCYAGIAFSNSSTNLAHAAGRPLGTRFHIQHGLSVSLLLPFVMLFGLEAAKERYANIAIALGSDPSLNTDQLANISLKIIESYNEKFGIWDDGRKYIDVQKLRDSIPILVDDAMSGNGILTNVRIPTSKDVSAIYEMLAEKLIVQ
ncbi:iron-containing alcohol dehydrogenase [Fodinisporobacter ferrooxydans]|uniref:Iron-containing alcohol dehydrogenase n=1 Tax=Fodinisporobacter ferrooxydans TaxID=2901836 RepID=A0ABY4CI24_9BACL|nr:iron-containing alcohol dehydrogenase [Alicyclobacillaceae bacterium MYW30-H2]